MLRERVALRCLGKDATVTDLTYADLQEQSNRFAHLLGTLGITRGERVFWLAGRVPILEDMALLHFTSGTTGTPKGAHPRAWRRGGPHWPPAATRSTCIPDDIFWCTADPGWVTGTSYGIIAPLVHGVTCIVDEPIRRRTLVPHLCRTSGSPSGTPRRRRSAC
jgi:acyl-coenzyme A synthetase/AMP-(fatty) acid ligase